MYVQVPNEVQSRVGEAGTSSDTYACVLAPVPQVTQQLMHWCTVTGPLLE